MDVMELNGGRFYLRPLHDDDRIDDRPALKKLRVNPDDFISMARISLDRYCWAICEQTSVEMVALGVYDHALGDIVTHPIGDPNRVLPNDPVLPPKTVQDAADDGLEIISQKQWPQKLTTVLLPPPPATSIPLRFVPLPRWIARITPPM